MGRYVNLMFFFQEQRTCHSVQRTCKFCRNGNYNGKRAEQRVIWAFREENVKNQPELVLLVLFFGRDAIVHLSELKAE